MVFDYSSGTTADAVPWMFVQIGPFRLPLAVSVVNAVAKARAVEPACRSKRYAESRTCFKLTEAAQPLRSVTQPPWAPTSRLSCAHSRDIGRGLAKPRGGWLLRRKRITYLLQVQNR